MRAETSGRGSGGGWGGGRPAPWTEPGFWAAVESELQAIDPAELARFLIGARLPRAAERAIWARLSQALSCD